MWKNQTVPYWISLQHGVPPRILPWDRVGTVGEVFDEINESHVAMVGCADKILYPAEVEGMKGERKEERERDCYKLFRGCGVT